MTIIDGKAIAQKVLSELTANPSKKPVRAVAISISKEPEIKSFIEMKKKYAERVGMALEHIEFETDVPEEEVLRKIKELSEDPCITGMIVEIPLAQGYDQQKILDAVPVEKDIDVLSTNTLEKFYKNGSRISPPAVEALDMLLRELGVNVSGKTSAVFGQSVLIGAPVSHYLEERGSKVFRIDESTENAGELSRQADIIVSGVGKPNLINGEMVKDGALVVDFGFEKLNGKTHGDVEPESVAPKASLTPVPGGMGPLVIAAFLKNAQILASSLER